MSNLSTTVKAAAAATASPTPAQAESGNYRKGKLTLHGLPITIETPKGKRRKPEWPPLSAHYGYVNRTEGRDGDHVDVFIGPQPESEIVFVIDQETKAGRFDEHKAMLGFTNQNEAKEAYLKCYSPGWRVGPITAMTVDQFKAWLDVGDTSSRIEHQVSRYAKWDESKHPRGNPDNAGQFASLPGGTPVPDAKPPAPKRPKPAIPKPPVPGAKPPQVRPSLRQQVAADFGITLGDVRNKRRADNFLLLAARKIGFNPEAHAGKDRESQIDASAKFLASQRPIMNELVNLAKSYGYRGKAQHLVTRAMSASNFLVREATKRGYQPAGDLTQDLQGSVEHLQEYTASDEQGDNFLLGNESLMSWLGILVLGLYAVSLIWDNSRRGDRPYRYDLYRGKVSRVFHRYEKNPTESDQSGKGWRMIGGGAPALIDFETGSILAACEGLEGEDVDEIGEGEDSANRDQRDRRQEAFDLSDEDASFDPSEFDEGHQPEPETIEPETVESPHDSVGDARAAAGEQMEKMPSGPVKHLIESLHGLRETRKTGKATTKELGEDYAKEVYSHLKKSKRKGDGFGEVYDLADHLGPGAIGYHSPAGVLAMIPPQFKGDDWEVRYSVDVYQTPPKPSPTAKPNSPPKEKPHPAHGNNKLAQEVKQWIPDDPDGQKALYETAQEVHKMRKQIAESYLFDREELLGQFFAVRRGETAKNAGARKAAYIRSLQRGEDNFKRFDELLDMAENHYPQLLHPVPGEGDDGPEGNLRNNLRKPARDFAVPPVHSDAILRDAADLLFEGAGAESGKGRTYESFDDGGDFISSIPFSRWGRKLRYTEAAKRWRSKAREHQKLSRQG